MTKNIYKIDAADQSLGRIATRAAFILRGKNLATYNPSEMPKNEVLVQNLKKAKFTGKKLAQKVYHHYSGYHSGIKTRKLSELWETRPQKVFHDMVYRMLPENKLRSRIIKNLKFE